MSDEIVEDIRLCILKPVPCMVNIPLMVEQHSYTERELEWHGNEQLFSLPY